MSQEIARKVFVFNPKDNGGEQLILVTKIFDNGDEKDNIYIEQELILHSYSNSASFNLAAITLTPEVLRKLANELESQLITASIKR